jgi:hypothetical protein
MSNLQPWTGLLLIGGNSASLVGLNLKARPLMLITLYFIFVLWYEIKINIKPDVV